MNEASATVINRTTNCSQCYYLFSSSYETLPGLVSVQNNRKIETSVQFIAQKTSLDYLFTLILCLCIESIYYSFKQGPRFRKYAASACLRCISKHKPAIFCVYDSCKAESAIAFAIHILKYEKIPPTSKHTHTAFMRPNMKGIYTQIYQSINQWKQRWMERKCSWVVTFHMYIWRPYTSWQHTHTHQKITLPTL